MQIEQLSIPTSSFIKNINYLIEDNLIDNIILSTINKLYKKEHKVNVIIRKKEIKIELVKYLHIICGYLTINTFIKAIVNNNFILWPGLTVGLINKHLPKAIHTYQGHLHLERQGL